MLSPRGVRASSGLQPLVRRNAFKSIRCVQTIPARRNSQITGNKVDRMWFLQEECTFYRTTFQESCMLDSNIDISRGDVSGNFIFMAVWKSFYL